MRRVLISIFILAALVVFSSAVLAEAPHLVNYQGILTDAGGDPLNGTHDLSFRIYADSAQGADDLWSERHTGVLIEEGLFNIILGSISYLPDTLFANGERWLGISVDSDPEMRPRMQITSVPWALRATVADSAITATVQSDGDWNISGDDIHTAVPGKVGIGTPSPQVKLDVYDTDIAAARMTSVNPYGSVLQFKNATAGASTLGRIKFTDSSDNDEATITYYSNPSLMDAGLYCYLGGSLRMMIDRDTGEVGIGTAFPGEMLDVAGTVKAEILKLSSGADIAEPFDIEGMTAIEAGMVVGIDPEHPGKLKICVESYDRCVAGIVSGAGELGPGMIMGQEGSVACGEHPVALTGRVYCLADASNGPIVPGDLLTSSETPGHAMKVTDFERAQGAVIGKAMSSLDEGRGLVLVLVSLQ